MLKSIPFLFKNKPPNTYWSEALPKPYHIPALGS